MDTKTFAKKLGELLDNNRVVIIQDADYVFVKLAYYVPNTVYSETEIARISKHDLASYALDFTSDGLGLTDNRIKKVADLVNEYASTPISNRDDDSKKYNVIISEYSFISDIGIVAWHKSAYPNKFSAFIGNLNDLKYDQGLVFTSEEFNSLVDFLKLQPNGEHQAKMAELGKVEVGDAK